MRRKYWWEEVQPLGFDFALVRGVGVSRLAGSLRRKGRTAVRSEKCFSPAFELAIRHCEEEGKFLKVFVGSRRELAPW